MADHCNICDTRRPLGGTNMLCLNGGELWVEFCPHCGENSTLTNGETGAIWLVRELFDACRGGNSAAYVRKPADIARAAEVAAREAEAADTAAEYDAYWEAYNAAVDAHAALAAQPGDHWDDHEYRCQRGGRRAHLRATDRHLRMRPLPRTRRTCPRYAVAGLN